MNNTALKILSVFIAVALWIYVYSGEHRELSVRVPVTLTEAQDGTMATVFPQEVTARISGPRALVTKASVSDEFKLVINLSELSAGANTIKLSLSDIKGSGVDTVDIIPSRIDVNIEPTVKRTLPVRAQIMDDPPKGYKISSINVTPRQAEAEGLRNTIITLQNLHTENISVADLITKSDFTVEFHDYNGIKQIVPSSVVVAVEVIEDVISYTFNNVSVSCLSGTEVSFVKTPEVSVIVLGRRDRVEALTPDELLIPIDCSLMKTPGEHVITPFVQAIDGITVTGMKPANIKTEVLP